MVMGLLVCFIIAIALFYMGVRTLRNKEKTTIRGVFWMIASIIFFSISFGPTIGGHMSAPQACQSTQR